MTIAPRVNVYQCAPEDYALVARVLQYAQSNMPHKDAILAYGDAPNEKSFYVRRNKAGFSIWKITR